MSDKCHRLKYRKDFSSYLDPCPWKLVFKVYNGLDLHLALDPKDYHPQIFR